MNLPRGQQTDTGPVELAVILNALYGSSSSLQDLSTRPLLSSSCYSRQVLDMQAVNYFTGPTQTIHAQSNSKVVNLRKFIVTRQDY